MARIINSAQIAIFYETITGQAQTRFVLTTDTTENIDAVVARHHGLQAVIVDRDQLPGPNQNEAFFRQAVATATKTAVFAKNADRCIQVGPSAVTPVISVHCGHVAGLDFPDVGNTLVPHATAEVGDTYTHGTGAVTRRYAVVNPVTGVVNQIANLAVGPSVPLPPLPGNVLVPSLTLQVGDVVPIKK